MCAYSEVRVPEKVLREISERREVKEILDEHEFVIIEKEAWSIERKLR